MRKVAVIAAALTLSSAASGAGVDSRALRCGDLHGMIGAYGYVFIAQPFGDFVVANSSFCSPGEHVQTRSVATTDTPQCPVNYCIPRVLNPTDH